MKKLSTLLIILLTINFAFSQTITEDTLSARDYVLKADQFKKEKNYDNALVYLEKAGNIYSKYNLNKAFLECELKKSEIFIRKKDLNKASNILSSREQQIINLFGKNSALYADYCNKKGLAYFYAGKYPETKGFWIKTLVINRKLYGNKHLAVSDAYNNLGGLYARTGEYYKSLKLYKNALEIREELLPQDDLKIASSLINIGSAYLKIDIPELSVKYYLRALTIKKNRLNPYNSELASLYYNLGIVYQILKDYDKSLINYKNALKIKQHNLGENNPETAELYEKTAFILNLKGEYNKALEYNEKALTVFKTELGEENPAIVKTMQNIGTVYLKMNDIKKAVEYFNNSLEISKKLYEIWNLKTAKEYTKVGKIFAEESKNNAAINYFLNTYKIQQNVFQSENHIEFAETFQNIAAAYQADEEYYQAIEYYNKCSALQQKILGNKHPQTAYTYYLTATAYKAKRNYAQELNLLQKALISNIENFDSQNINSNPDFNSDATFYYDQNTVLKTLNEKADAFYNLYLRTNNIQNLKSAFNVYGLSDLFFNKIKADFFGAEKTNLTENMSSTYEKAITVCMLLYKKTNESTYVNKAFQYSEKIKSNSLNNAIVSLKIKKFAGVPDTVLNTETDLSADIYYFRNRVSKDPDDFTASTKLDKLKRKRQAFILMLKNNYPEYYELKYQPFSVSTQNFQNLINDSTLVLDYFFPEQLKFIYTFIIGKDYADMKVFRKDDNFDDQVKSFRRHIFSDTEDNMMLFAEEANRLYDKLIPNILSEDTSFKQLLIIPDGALDLIPFEALLTEAYNGNINDYNAYPYLIKKYAVSYSYSADLFYKTFYTDKLDDFIPAIIDSTDITDSLVIKPMYNWVGIAPIFGFANNGKDYVSSLSESENEVNAVYNVFINAGQEAVLKTYSDATETFLKSDESDDFDFIHIASHAFINSEEPGLSSILFSQNTTNGNDGVLYTGEMFNLEFDPELTVLSACETDLGNEKSESGLPIFTRALFYAGTKNIILSLKQIKNASIEELMTDFYSDFLNQQEQSASYIYSLQSAKLKLIEDGRYAHPRYWSPFILIGE